MKNVNVNAKQAKTAQHVKLEETLLTWFKEDEDDPRISLLDAIHFIAMAWNRVTPTTVANCFGKCGFFGSPEEVPPEPEDPTIEDWEQRNVECTSDDFCTADDNLATCGARTVEDIVEEATCEAADSSDDGDDIDVGDDEGRAPAAEILHALDVLRRAVAADEVSDDTCTRFYAFEQSLLGIAIYGLLPREQKA
ncbi:hypothetical protein MRX96_023979 [Rhipicephalus microplus]